MDKSAGLVRAANFNFLSICMWKLLFSQGGTWAFVMIIYLYYNRPRKPQRGLCNVRGHTDTTLPRGTREAKGRAQDGLTLPAQMDTRLPIASMWRIQTNPHRAHMELAANQGLQGFYMVHDGKLWQLKPPIAQLHSTAWMDRWTHGDAPHLAEPQGSAQGARQMPLQNQLSDEPQLKAAAWN